MRLPLTISLQRLTHAAVPSQRPQVPSLSLHRALSTPSDPQHHDLPTFLAYAARTNLSSTSTTYVGTHYEYTVQRALVRLGLTLCRTGGRLDRGIDLLGTWQLPSLPRAYPLRVLVQCKAISRKAGPNLVRELEGAFAGAPARWREELDRVRERGREREREREQEELEGGAGVGDEVGGEAGVGNGLDGGLREDGSQGAVAGASGTVALLVAPTVATKGVRDAMGRSRLPMAYAKVSQGGRVEQMLWNRSAADKGLEGLGISTRFRPWRVPVTREDESPGESLEQEVVLTWDGDIWEGFQDDAGHSVSAPGEQKHGRGDHS